MNRGRARVLVVLGSLLACVSCTEHLQVLHGEPVAHPTTTSTCERPEPPSGLVALPARTVGDGTPESCTATALADALRASAAISFACGTGSITIQVPAEIAVNVSAVIDGGDLVDNQPKITLRASARAFTVAPSADGTPTSLLLKNITISGAQGPLAHTDDDAVGGGAIFNDGSELIVEGCTFDDNSSGNTGGAIGGHGKLVVIDSSFSGNSAHNGGAIGLGAGEMLIIDSRIEANHANENGGGVYIAANGGKTTLCGTALTDNTAVQIAGGLYVSDIRMGMLVVQESSFVRNRAGDPSTASGEAGAIYTQGANVSMARSTVAGNEASRASGMWTGAFFPPMGSTLMVVPGAISLENVTIAQNRNYGALGGAGLWLAPPLAGDLRNCTIAGNRAGMSAGISGATDQVTLRNSIIMNDAPRTPVNCAQQYGAPGSVNVQFPAEPSDTGQCAPGVTVADPKLGPLGDNGGPTQTMPVDRASVAAGAGNDCPAVDQRGRPRAHACALGAYEPN